MLDLTALFINYKKCESIPDDYKNMRLHISFYSLSVQEAINFIKIGFHPSKLPAKFYRAVVSVCSDKIFLFHPKYIAITDLLYVLELTNSINLYKHIIYYYRYEIKQYGTVNILKKCYTLLDTIYNLELLDVHHILTYPKIIYKYKIVSTTVLKKVFYENHILPLNKGLNMLQLEDTDFICDVLSQDSITDEEITYILLEVPDIILASSSMQAKVVELIHQRHNLYPFKRYVKDFITDDAVLGIYYNIFFPERDILTEYSLKDHVLTTVCKNIDCYLSSIDNIVTFLIANEKYELLGNMIDYIPKEMRNELLYINIIKSTKNTKPKIYHFKKYMSECLLLLCALNNYPDIIDFLYQLPVSLFIKHHINPFTDYAFSTNWFNSNLKLTKLFVELYFLDPIMMKKLLFDYTLTQEAMQTIIHTTGVLREIQMIKVNTFKIVSLSSVFALQAHKGKHPPDSPYVFTFISNTCSSFKISSQILHHNILKSLKVEKLYYYENGNKSHQLYFDISYKPLSVSERLIAQIRDLGCLARHGFLCLMPAYLGNWLPNLASTPLLENWECAAPAQIYNWKIKSLYIPDFIRHSDLPIAIYKFYNLDTIYSKETAIYSCLYSYLFVYILIGCFMLEQTETDLVSFITNIINAILSGLNINIRMVGVTHELILEIKSLYGTNNFRDNRPIHLLYLCRHICELISTHGELESSSSV